MSEDKVLNLAASKDAKRKKKKKAELQQLYKVSNGVICRIKAAADEYQEIPLTNFDARIEEEIVRDNGIETTTTFKIKGQLADGSILRTIEVPAEKFASMGWVVSEWGTRAVVYAGNGIKDHVRAAIQLLSLQANGALPRRTIYGHIGWRKIGDRWVYLHNEGAIGLQGGGIEVDAGSQLSSYVLPTPDNDVLQDAVKASLKILNLVGLEIAYPLLASIYRAPLGEVLPIDFSLFIAGPTGSQKSELTAIAQAHWGKAFTGKNLPANWSSTGNSLEKLAFLAKDAILTIDDFAPHGNGADIQRLHKEADRILRAQGNTSGRSRMNADGSLKPAYYPRGLIVASGEDIPNGQSLAARMVILEVNRGDVNLDVLTEMQRYAAEGLLAQSMAGYLAWLAPQIDELKKALPQGKNKFRDLIRQQGKMAHDRIPDNAASLAVGLEQFLRYAVAIKAIDRQEAKEKFSEGFEVLVKISDMQAQYQKNEDPTERFLALLSAAITTGQAHIADAKTGDAPPKPTKYGWEKDTSQYGGYKPKGVLIGWLDGDNLLLEPEAAYAMAQNLARVQNSSLTVGQKTLWRRMQQKGLLLSYEEGRLKQRWYVAGSQKRLIHISRYALVDDTENQEEQPPF